MWTKHGSDGCIATSFLPLRNECNGAAPKIVYILSEYTVKHTLVLGTSCTNVDRQNIQRQQDHPEWRVTLNLMSRGF